MAITAAAASAAICKHCLNPSPVGCDFCCGGCEGAYQLIHSLKLDQFYRYRSENKLDPGLLNQPKTTKWGASLTVGQAFAVETGDAQIELGIEGLTCSACIWLIEKLPAIYPDLRSLQVHFLEKRIVMKISSALPMSELEKIFGQFGFELFELSADSAFQAAAKEKKIWKMRIGIAFACLVGAMHVALNLYAGALDGMDTSYVRIYAWGALLISLPALTYSAIPFYRSAWMAIKVRRASMDLLVTAAIVLGFAFSTYNILLGRNEIYFDSLTMLDAFLLLGRWLALVAGNPLRAEKSLLWSAGLRWKDLKAGDIASIESGDTIPCDGLVLEGVSAVNTSWLTGEEAPLHIKAGDSVLAGSRNEGDRIRVKALAVGAQTRAGQIYTRALSSQKSKWDSVSQRLESFFVISTFCLVSFFVFYGFEVHEANIQRALSILMVMCPCALGLAVPSVFAAALGQALDRGIFIRSGEIFDRLSSILNIVFDKTGTLTEPTLSLSSETWFDTKSSKRSDFELLLARLVWSGRHPIMLSLRPRFSEQDQRTQVLVSQTQGVGVSGQFEGKPFTFGRSKDAPLSSEGESIAELVWDGSVIARFGFQGQVRASATSLVSKLKDKYQLWILSGDNPSAVSKIAQQLQIPASHTLTEALPEQKQDWIRAHQLRAPTLFVGDGLNDVLAMKAAQVGVAVGGGVFSGLTQSDVYLQKPNLMQIEGLFLAAARVKKVILINFLWTALYNAVAVGLVLTVGLPSLICAISMPLSSLTVVALARGVRYFPKGDL